MKPLQFQSEAMAAMTQDATKSFPHECCGFLLGQDSPSHREIEEILEVDNRVESNAARRFAISPRDYMRAERRALAAGLQLIGVYHSHPSHPAVPSIHDLRVALPTFSYAIVSMYADGLACIRSWQLNENQIFSEEPILNNIPTSWLLS